MEPVNVSEYERIARDTLPQGAFDYVAGAADDEITVVRNRAAFRQIKLRPRTLVDVSDVSTTTTVLEEAVNFPVLLAPTGFQGLAHVDADLASARAATAAGTVFVASTLSSRTLEDIAADSSGPKWFQLYCYRDKEVTRELVSRAEAAGYRAVCVTVDAPRLGRRERDVRNRVQLPETAMPRNFDQLVDLSSIPVDERGSAIQSFAADLLDASLTWSDVDWLRAQTTLPLLIKGVLTAADAQLAVAHSVDGIVVSNHGGRQLDGVPATIEVLEEIVDAVGGATPVLVDGGVRRGTDVLKAIAIGAQATLIGRPYVWGLAADGERGVMRVLDLLRAEFELAMALAGCRTVSEIRREHVILPGETPWA